MKHLTLRLDDETNGIVEKYEKQFGVTTSKTIERLIQAADGKQFVTVISTALSHSEELSFFAGQLEKTKLLWREIKSRLNAPRPLDASDTDAVKQWRADRERIQKFYDECDTLWRQSHSLSAVLTTSSADEWSNMQGLASVLRRWSKECQDSADKETDPAIKKMNLKVKADIELASAFLHRLGIEPTPPNLHPPNK